MNEAICFQITHFMSQQFSIAPIIEFVETDNREIKENISFQSNASKFRMLLSTNIFWYYCEGKHAESYDIVIRNTNLRKRGLIMLRP